MLAVMKGIILAGGTGSRLHPVTIATSKQLMPVYDKPMIYYPLSTLMLAGIREILVITSPHDERSFLKLLGDGGQFGVNISYAVQEKPNGIAEAFLIAENFINSDEVALVLGDNIFHSSGLAQTLQQTALQVEGATIFACKVSNPEDYGVIEFDSDGNAISIEEKPTLPKSRYVIPGLYFYGNDVVSRAKSLVKSERGELEISDLNASYLAEGKLRVQNLERGTVWLDTGTFDSLLDAAEFVRVLERRQGLKISCPEEVSWRMGYINNDQLKNLAENLLKSGYGRYLLSLLDE